MKEHHGKGTELIHAAHFQMWSDLSTATHFHIRNTSTRVPWLFICCAVLPNAMLPGACFIKQVYQINQVYLS